MKQYPIENVAWKVKSNIKKEMKGQRAAQSYHLQKGYALFALQNQKTSSLHAFANAYVIKNVCQPLQLMAIPAQPNPPTIMLKSFFSGSDDGDEGDEDYCEADYEDDEEETGSREQEENNEKTGKCLTLGTSRQPQRCRRGAPEKIPSKPWESEDFPPHCSLALSVYVFH